MFIGPIVINKNGKRHAYWALVESVRTKRGPRQRTVAYIGAADDALCEGVEDAAKGRSRSRQKKLFSDAKPSWVEVDASRVRVERCREFGGPWPGLELIGTIGLDAFFEKTIASGREEIPCSLMAMVLVLCRLCDPSSELHIAEDFFRHSAPPDLLGIPSDKINEDRLYRALDRLLPHKTQLEAFLKERLGELFDLNDSLLLYDVTSTCFEGEANANPQAKRDTVARIASGRWTEVWSVPPTSRFSSATADATSSERPRACSTLQR